jgi:hypothetical protein
MALKYTLWGETKTLDRWAIDYRCVCNVSTLRKRLARKRRKSWTLEEALTKPVERKYASRGPSPEQPAPVEYGEIMAVNTVAWQ